MKQALRRSAAAFIVSLFAFAAQSQSSRNVDFFGVISSDADANMIQMTETLYLTQLGEVPGISVIDRRQSGFAEAYKAHGEPDFSKASSPLAFTRSSKKKTHRAASGTARSASPTYAQTISIRILKPTIRIIKSSWSRKPLCAPYSKAF